MDNSVGIAAFQSVWVNFRSNVKVNWAWEIPIGNAEFTWVWIISIVIEENPIRYE